MKLEKIWAVYFSGTGTTWRTVERIAGGIASRLNLPAESVDFSHPAVRQETLGFGEKGSGGFRHAGVRRARTQCAFCRFCRRGSWAAVRWRCRWCCLATGIMTMPS